jgi:hypothetical protein
MTVRVGVSWRNQAIALRTTSRVNERYGDISTVIRMHDEPVFVSVIGCQAPVKPPCE